MFVVLGRTEYEGDTLIAVYASLVEAEAAVDAFERRGVPFGGSEEGWYGNEAEWGFDEYVISEREMGVVPSGWSYE